MVPIPAALEPPIKLGEWRDEEEGRVGAHEKHGGGFRTSEQRVGGGVTEREHCCPEKNTRQTRPPAMDQQRAVLSDAAVLPQLYHKEPCTLRPTHPNIFDHSFTFSI